MNNYMLKSWMITNTADAEVTNIAFDRMKYFLIDLDSTVFVDVNDTEACERYLNAGIRVTTLPKDPVDQILGVMFYYKLNAIMEGHMIISGLDISSSLGDNVWYMHDEEDNAGPFAKDGWWHKASVQHQTLELETIPDNVVKVHSTGWHELGLDWPEDKPSTGNTVVFANFPKNEN